MTGKTHTAGGVLLSLILSWGSFPGAMFTLLGSVLPDIDHKDSLLGKTFPFIPRIIKHRGFTHSILFCVLCWFISPYLAAGVLLHIMFDAFTVSGVSLFYPFNRRVNVFNAKTDGTFEKILFVLIWIGIVAVIGLRISLPRGTELYFLK